MRSDLCLTPWAVSGKSSDWADDYYDSIFFLGNGRMGVRGYVSSEPSPRPIQKGIYVAGIFGEIKPGLTDFVNLPTPAYHKIFNNNQAATLASEIRRVLDLKTATLTRSYTVCAEAAPIRKRTHCCCCMS